MRRLRQVAGSLLPKMCEIEAPRTSTITATASRQFWLGVTVVPNTSSNNGLRHFDPLQEQHLLCSPRPPKVIIAGAAGLGAVRGLAIKKSRGKSRKVESRQALPLMNEKLVKKIMDESAETSASNVNLRLVIEKDTKTPPVSEATTLDAAIATAVDLGLDLVAIDLNHELPVVRAVKYEAKLYNLSKEKAKVPKDPGTIVKEFRFKAKTADNDFYRKIKDVVDALKKGHKCKITARCPLGMVGTKFPDGVGEVVDRVLAEVQGAGDVSKPPEINKEKTQANLLLIPSTK